MYAHKFHGLGKQVEFTYSYTHLKNIHHQFLLYNNMVFKSRLLSFSTSGDNASADTAYIDFLLTPVNEKSLPIVISSALSFYHNNIALIDVDVDMQNILQQSIYFRSNAEFASFIIKC